MKIYGKKEEVYIIFKQFIKSPLGFLEGNMFILWKVWMIRILNSESERMEY